MRDFAVLIVRLVAGHAAQKLFGSFGGPGMEGFAGFMESMGMSVHQRLDVPASVAYSASSNASNSSRQSTHLSR